MKTQISKPAREHTSYTEEYKQEAMERGGSGEAAQGRSGKGGVGGTVAGGDDDDGGLDRRTPGDGQSGAT